MHLLSCGSIETKRQNLQHRNFVIEKIWWPKMARKVRDQKQHSDLEDRGFWERQEGKRIKPEDPVRNGRSNVY